MASCQVQLLLSLATILVCSVRPFWAASRTTSSLGVSSGSPAAVVAEDMHFGARDVTPDACFWLCGHHVPISGALTLSPLSVTSMLAGHPLRLSWRLVALLGRSLSSGHPRSCLPTLEATRSRTSPSIRRSICLRPSRAWSVPVRPQLPKLGERVGRRSREIDEISFPFHVQKWSCSPPR